MQVADKVISWDLAGTFVILLDFSGNNTTTFAFGKIITTFYNSFQAPGKMMLMHFFVDTRLNFQSFKMLGKSLPTLKLML